jgi:hypothetical protein
MSDPLTREAVRKLRTLWAALEQAHERIELAQERIAEEGDTPEARAALEVAHEIRDDIERNFNEELVRHIEPQE